MKQNAVAVGVLVAIVGVSGCSVPAGSLTAPPDTEDAAIEQAFATVKEYWALEDQILITDLGKDPERIKSVATTQVAADLAGYADRQMQSNDTPHGTRDVTFIRGRASERSEDGRTYPFGTAEMTVCNDLSRTYVTGEDGTSYPRPYPIRQTNKVKLVFAPGERKWLVEDIQTVSPREEC